MAKPPARRGRAVPGHIGVLQRPAQYAARPVFRWLWPTEVEGLDNIPVNSGAILCPNHLSVFDSFLLPSVLPRPLIFVGKAEYLDDWKTRRLFPALGMIPIERGSGRRTEPALDAARQVLDAGGLFGIYPEGTRSRSTHLHKGHTGAARLAIGTATQIIPVGFIGTLDIQPPGQPFPRPFRPATVRFGKPIDVRRYVARADDRAVYRQLIDEVMYEISQLTDQTYVDRYASAKDEPGVVRSSGRAPRSIRPTSPRVAASCAAASARQTPRLKRSARQSSR